MDEQSKLCRACNGNPEYLKAGCHYCEIRSEWQSENDITDDDITDES